MNTYSSPSQCIEEACSDIELIMEHTGVSRDIAISTLKNHHGDILSALLEAGGNIFDDTERIGSYIEDPHNYDASSQSSRIAILERTGNRSENGDDELPDLVSPMRDISV